MKNGIDAEIIADSINPVGKRITTFLLKYPRMVHAEFMTHRVFSRNAASSRAIPVHKIIQAIQDDPAMPRYWGKNQSGMQAASELEGDDLQFCKDEWLLARNDANVHAQNLMARKLHKQIANRVLEPWFHIQTLVTATEWGNFFNLRVHKDAQPEIQEVAKQAMLLIKDSVPKALAVGEWHLPFNAKGIDVNTPFDVRLKIVTARAARTSYLNFDGKIEIEKDIELHDGLLKSRHSSPFEHAAQCVGDDSQSGNFKGWMQYRKTIKGENQEVYDADELLERLG